MLQNIVIINKALREGNIKRELLAVEKKKSEQMKFGFERKDTKVILEKVIDQNDPTKTDVNQSSFIGKALIDKWGLGKSLGVLMSVKSDDTKKQIVGEKNIELRPPLHKVNTDL